MCLEESNLGEKIGQRGVRNLCGMKGLEDSLVLP